MGVVYDKFIYFLNAYKHFIITFILVFTIVCFGYDVNALGAITYRSGTQLSSCNNCNQIDIPFGQSITDVRINYGDKQYTAGEKFVVHVGLEFRGNQPYLDSINSCTFYIDVNNTTASWPGTVGRNYYETNSQYLSYNSGFGFVTGEIPVNMSSFTANSYVICNITNDSLGRDMNHFGFDMRFSSIGGDLNSAIANAADSINANNNANNNSVLNGISQGNQNLQDINSDMDDIKDMFEDSNEIGGEISEKMDTNNTLLGTISSKIQSFKDSVDSFLSGISQKIGDLIFGSKVCETSETKIYYSDAIITNSFLNPSGEVRPSNDNITGISDYYSFDRGTQIVIVSYSGNVMYSSSFCLYDSEKNLKSCTAYDRNTRFTVTPDFDGYIRTTIKQNNTITLNLNHCTNGNQTIFGKIRDFFDDLLNPDLGYGSDGTGIGAEFEQIQQIPDTPISDLLLMPVNFLNAIYSSLGGSCSSYTIPFDFTGGTNTLTLPCFDGSRYFGSTLWNGIDILFSGFMVYNIGMMVIGFYESWSSLEDTFDSLYPSKHSMKNASNS